MTKTEPLPTVGQDVLAKLEAIDDPAILLDRDHRILAVNSPYQARYGRTITLGESRCFTISHGYERPCDLEGETCPVKACLATGRSARVTHVHLHDGQPETCAIELLPVADSTGELIYFIEVLRSTRPSWEEALVARSPRFREALDLVRAVAPTEVPVLLTGETGTGKERVAEALHAASARSEGPLVAVECPGIQETLFESELFGHERGAFTGADRRREGLVDAARGGTLFLDEIGDLSLAMQVKLLRLLEANMYRRVGSTRPLQADFRLIAATHRDLSAMVDAGTFRADLYYRLAVFPIALPSLRERIEDVLPLAEQLAEGAVLTPAARGVLLRRAWPGNIRELRNVLQRARVLARGGPVDAVHVASGTARQNNVEPMSTWPWGDRVLPLTDVEARYLAWAEQRLPIRSELAHALGLSVRQLYRRLAKVTTDPDA